VTKLTKFACSRCGVLHEEKESITLKQDGGLVVYGMHCVREMVIEIDKLTKGQAADELLHNTDPVREIFLARRAEGVKSTVQVRRKTEDINLYLVRGGRR